MKAQYKVSDYLSVADKLFRGDKLEDVPAILRDMVDFYAENEGKSDVKSRITRQTIESIAMRFLKEGSYYLCKENLLEAFYDIAPNPFNLSSMASNILGSRSELRPMAIRALKLGGLMSLDHVQQYSWRLRDYDFDVDLKMATQLLENLKNGSWAIEIAAEPDDFYRGYTVMLVAVFSKLARKRDVRGLVDLMLNESETLNKFKYGLMAHEGKDHYFLYNFVASSNPGHRFLKALHERDSKLYDQILEANKSSIYYALRSADLDHFDLGKLPPSPVFTPQFCAEVAADSMCGWLLSVEGYKGIQRQYARKKPEKSLAQMIAEQKKVVKAVKAYKDFRKAVDAMDSSKIDANDLYRYVRTNELLETLYIPAAERLEANPERIEKLAALIIRLGNHESMERFFEKHPDACLGETYAFQELVQVAVAGKDRKRDMARELVFKALGSESLRQQFASLSKSDYDILFSNPTHQIAAHLRQIRWQDNEIKREILSVDMGL